MCIPNGQKLGRWNQSDENTVWIIRNSRASGIHETAPTLLRTNSLNLWDKIASNTSEVQHIILQPTGWLNVLSKHSKELYKQVNRVADLLIRGWSIFYSVTAQHYTAQLIELLAVYSWSKNWAPGWICSDPTMLLKWEREASSTKTGPQFSCKATWVQNWWQCYG